MIDLFSMKNADESRADKLRDWFSGRNWLEGWSITPHASVDRHAFSEQYHRNADLWKRAFSFLANTDLFQIGMGVHELVGDNVLVNVQQYVTCEEADTRYEAHRKYADIQYMVSGEEKIGVVPLKDTAEIVPYDAANDIVFLTAENNRYHMASQNNFFIFLPDNAHRPCVKNHFAALVKKVVVKVRVNR